MCAYMMEALRLQDDVEAAEAENSGEWVECDNLTGCCDRGMYKRMSTRLNALEGGRHRHSMHSLTQQRTHTHKHRRGVRGA